MAWQKTVGGCLKGDLGFSNAFLVPELSDKQRASIIKAGEKVLAARELHPDLRITNG